VVIRDTDLATFQWVNYGGKQQTTNNEMELKGALETLRLCPVGHDITLYMDTQYFLKGVINGGIDGSIAKSKLGKGVVFTGWVNGWMSRGWTKADGKKVLNLELWKQIVGAIEQHIAGGSTLHFQWVKGHSGVEGNELADSLANLGVPD
jgi:ribonuclease HI